MIDEFWNQPDVVQQFASREPDHRVVAILADTPHGAPLKVLDLGCAGGRNTALAAEHGLDVWAVDASPPMVERTRERLVPLIGAEEAAARVKVGRMDDLSAFGDGFFDLIVALGIYHNARSRDEWEAAIAESARVLRPGGRLLVNHFTPEVDLTGEGVEAVPDRRDEYDGFPGGRVVLMDAQALDRAMAGHGLRPLSSSETIRVEAPPGRRVSVNALYRHRGISPTTDTMSTPASNSFDEIEPLGERKASLAHDPATFRAAGHALVDQISDFLESVPERPVTPAENPQAVRTALGSDLPLPEAGIGIQELMGTTAELLFAHSLFNGHPRFFGYITSSPSPIGMLGDLLAAAVNPNVGAWALSPMATEIEAQTVRWIAELIGYPAGCGGLFVSGGNMANFVAFVAARAAAAGSGVRETGFRADQRPIVYASAETHTWIQKASDLFGLGTDSIRWIPVDNEQRMDVAELRRAMERDAREGALPMLVVGTAGSVSTGAIDPLAEIAEVCRSAAVWFHVDGAYGGVAAAWPGAPADLKALSLADSVAVDPHKWLYAPLEAGCVLVRNAEALRAAFSYHPPYYHFGTEAINYFDYGLQNSRGFRALKVWLAIRQAGRSGYIRMIEDDIRLSERLHAKVADHPELEALTQSLSITTFRYVPSELRGSVGSAGTDEYLNQLNERLLETIQRSGEAFVSNAVVGGRYALRACIVNFNTRAADVDAMPDIAVRLGRAEHARLA